MDPTKDPVSVTAHEVRALSASLAAYKGVALGDVLEEATWSTPHSLCSTCATAPFWPTLCGQSAQSSQPSTWCDRGRRDLHFLGFFPVRPSIPFRHAGPTSLLWRLWRGPGRSLRPSVSPSPLPRPGGGVLSSCPTREVTGREPSLCSGSLVTLL
jgi:hypothetical protein